MAHQFETTLMVGLLQTQQHNLGHRTPSVAAQCCGGVPRVVRMAEQYFAENLGAAITLEEVALEIGASARALQLAFQGCRGRSPMTVLRDMRIERAWVELRHPGPVLRQKGDQAKAHEISSPR